MSRPWRKLQGPQVPRLVGSTRDYAEEHHVMMLEIERLIGLFPAACQSRRMAIVDEIVGVQLAARRLSESYQRQARLRRVAR